MEKGENILESEVDDDQSSNQDELTNSEEVVDLRKTNMVGFRTEEEEVVSVFEIKDHDDDWPLSSSDDEDDFQILNQQDILDTFQSVTQGITIFLAAIAGISLVVGGIGVMNIMLVSVTERTREIGIRKSLGAKRKDILLRN